MQNIKKSFLWLTIIGLFFISDRQLQASSNTFLKKTIQEQLVAAYNYSKQKLSQAKNYMFQEDLNEGIPDINHFIKLVSPDDIIGDLDEFRDDFEPIEIDGIVSYLEDNKSNESHGFIINENGNYSQLLVKLIAKKARAHYFEVQGDSFQSDGLAKINKLFEKAEEMSPSVIFISNVEWLEYINESDIACLSAEQALFLEKMKDLEQSNDQIIVFGEIGENELYDDHENQVLLDSLATLEFNKSIKLTSLLSNEYKLDENQIIAFLTNNPLHVKFSDNINFTTFARLIIKSYDFDSLIYPKTQYDLNYIASTAQKLALKEGSTVTTNQHLEEAAYLFVSRYQEDDIDYDSAIHEAGHAVVGLHLTSGAQVMHSISIQHNLTVGLPIVQGGNRISNLLSIDDYKNNITFLFAGIVAEQILGPKKLFLNYFKPKKLSVSEFLSPEPENDLLELFLDGELINKCIDAIISYKLTDKSKNYILEECYQKAVTLITKYKDEVKKVAKLLIKKHNISGDDLYDLLDINKPLYDFESGPLPKNLVENYKLRGDYDKLIKTPL